MGDIKAAAAHGGAAAKKSSRKMTSHRLKTWTYAEYPTPGATQYGIWAGDLLLALVKEKGDADLICRARAESTRLGIDVRRKSAKFSALNETNKMLMETLRRIFDILQKSGSPMEMINARSEIGKVLKRVTVGGRS